MDAKQRHCVALVGFEWNQRLHEGTGTRAIQLAATVCALRVFKNFLKRALEAVFPNDVKASVRDADVSKVRTPAFDALVSFTAMQSATLSEPTVSAAPESTVASSISHLPSTGLTLSILGSLAS